MMSKMSEIHKEFSLLKKAIRGIAQVYISKTNMPDSQAFIVARDSKELENFLWDKKD